MQAYEIKAKDPVPLLGPEEPGAYEIINKNGTCPILFSCEHASNLVPLGIGNLGVAEKDMNDHFAIDVGAANLTRRLCELLNAPAVLATYSRLVLDLNRAPNRDDQIPETYCGLDVPANQGLSPEDKQQRINTLFWPYHNKIEEMLNLQVSEGIHPVYVSLHSFTPNMNGTQPRPWEIGFIWDKKSKTALGGKLMQELSRRHPELIIGDNQPYSWEDVEQEPGGCYAIETHPHKHHLRHAFIETRYDQINTPQGVERWAKCLADLFQDVLKIEKIG